MLDMLKPVRTPEAKTPLVQLWEQVNWGARLMITPNDYRAYHLYRKGRGRREALRYLSGPRAEPLWETLNRETGLLEDKLAYENHFRALGLPVPRTLAVTAATPRAGDRPILQDAAQLASFLRERLGAGQQLVLKMLDSEHGIGVRVLTGIDGDDLLLPTGESAPLGPTVDGLLASDRVWLLQERITQHPDLDELNSSSLNSLRLVTFRHRNGDVDIALTTLRIGRASAQTDGYSKGGCVAVQIDPVTGRFADQGAQKPTYSLLPVDRHPDSGVAFASRTMPHWSEVCTMARAFATHAGANRYIGWDVASTPHGPVFVEGNEGFGVGLSQLLSDGMLTDDFVAMIHQEADLRYEVKRLPPLRPLHAFRSLRSRSAPEDF